MLRDMGMRGNCDRRPFSSWRQAAAACAWPRRRGGATCPLRSLWYDRKRAPALDPFAPGGPGLGRLVRRSEASSPTSPSRGFPGLQAMTCQAVGTVCQEMTTAFAKATNGSRARSPYLIAKDPGKRRGVCVARKTVINIVPSSTIDRIAQLGSYLSADEKSMRYLPTDLLSPGDGSPESAAADRPAASRYPPASRHPLAWRRRRRAGRHSSPCQVPRALDTARAGRAPSV